VATKKETEDKIVIKSFRDSSSNWWVGYKHYCLDENNVLQFICGGIEDRKETEAIQEFIKRNKKKYVPTKQSEVQKEYLEIINFGKYVNKSVQEVFHLDSKYLQWMYKEYSFSSSQEKLKQEIKEILGK
jgi:GTPase SAR1 family protein